MSPESSKFCRVLSHRIGIVIFIIPICFSCALIPELNSVNYPPIKRGTKYYRVKKGDTLFAISWRAGRAYRTVAKWNGISPPYTLKIGQRIQLFNSNQFVKKRKEVSKRNKKTASNKNSNPRSDGFKENSKKKLKVRWQWPIRGVITKSFSQSGGKGLDITGNRGQAVLAAAAGKVVYSGSGLIGYGNLIIVKHSDEFLSAYGNNWKAWVKEGEWVRRGQKIAELGGKLGGRSALHFEIRNFGKPVNPTNYLPKR